MANKTERNIHWRDEKEVLKTNRPLLLLLLLMKKIPKPLVFTLIYPIAFFYFVFSKRARNTCRLYQIQLQKYAPDIHFHKSSFFQILSFTLCVMEKMEGWLGNYHYTNLVTHKDDLSALQAQLEEKKGALLIGSHLGNIELLRSLSSFGENGVKREYSVITIAEIKATQQFNNTLKIINPDTTLNVIDPSQISPDTIIQMQEHIENGGLVVITGDRTSANSRTRTIREKFLGKEADFPYGVFLLASLLHAPVYFVFGLRTKTSTIFPAYNMFVEKSKVSFECPRSERESRIKELCTEFVSKLEKYCIQYPYQWYNFFNFWLLNDKED